MNESVYEQELDNVVVKVYQDEDSSGPKDDEAKNLFLVGYHRDFSVDGPCHTIPEHLREIAHKSYCMACYQRNFTTVEETGNKCGKCGKETRVNHTFYKTSKGRPYVTKEECIDFANGEHATVFFTKYHIFGLEAYIHSGVVLALSQEGNFCDRRWDVSQLGFVFVAKSEWRIRKSAKKAARGLIEYWNAYLGGNVYGFVVKDKETGENLET